MKLTKSSRAFRRATAFVLAAALTLSAPVATNASAASKKVPSLSVKKKTLYYNKAGKKSFTLKVKKNKVKKIVKTKWTTSKKSVAKLSGKKKTKVKVTAKKKGTAKITAKVTYKAGSKTKTKKLVCKVTSKKANKVVNTEKPAPTTSSTAGPTAPVVTDAPTQAPTEAPTEAPTQAPTEAPTAEPSATPSAITANVANISAIDPSEFTVTLSFSNEVGEVTEDMIKDAKLEMKKGNITVTASYKSLEQNGTAIFGIDDTAALKPGNRNADGTYDVTSSSKNLVLPEKATTTYEEAIAALAVEGYVTKWNSTDNKYEPVEGATVTILNNGKTATTDSYGYYKIATNSGKKTMQVEKAGFVTQITSANQVSVNRNSLTAENFVLATYDVSKVYLNIQALNSKNEGIVVEGATVVLKDKDGKKVYESELKTDTSGKAVIANYNGNVSYSTNNKKPALATDAPYLVKDTEYTLEIEKKLSASNLNDVYKLYSGKVKIGGQYKHEVIAKVVKVAELPSMTITQKYNSDTEESLNADNTPLYYTYQLFAESLKDANGIAGALTTKTEVNMRATGNLAKDKTVSSDLIPLINNITSAPQAPNTTNNKATLPSGTYYVLVKSYGTDGTYATPSTTAYAVVQVVVTEGSAATASIVLTKGCTREITTNVGLRAIEKDTQGSVASGTALKVIEKTYAAAPAAQYQLVSPDIDVDASNILYQKMTGNVLVPVETSADTNPGLLVRLTDNGTYSAKNKYTHILGAGSYTLKTTSNYSKADDWNFDANDIVNQQHTVDADSKWALSVIKIKVQADDALVGKTVGTDAPKLKAIRILDSSDKEVAKYTYADGSEVQADGSASLSVNDIVNFPVDVAALKLLDRGNYKVEATLVGCNPVKSAVTNTVGLERLESSITEKVVLSTSTDKTTLSGNVMIQKLDKTSYKADDTTHLVQVVLLDSTGKIAGVGKTNASGNYSIVDKTSNGTQARLGTGSYTLVARGKTAETLVKTVTLTDKQTLTENLTMADGATGTIKVRITNTNKNGITGARVKATDAYFVKDSTTENKVWVSGTASGTGVDTSLLGLYDDSTVSGVAGVVPEEREVLNLSEGTYNLEFYGNSNYVFVNQTETLSGIGDKKYPEFQFSPKAENTGSGLIPLTVKYSGVTTDNCVVVAKTQDGQIADIKYRGTATETNPVTGGASDNPTSYTVLNVPSHQNYNIYVYNLSGKYVATTTKNVQGFAAEVTVAFDTATVD